MTLADEALAISLRSGAVKYEFIVRAELALLHGENGRRDEAEANLVRCREILADGTLGPVYFIRLNRHNGWNETNTPLPLHQSG